MAHQLSSINIGNPSHTLGLEDSMRFHAVLEMDDEANRA